MRIFKEKETRKNVLAFIEDGNLEKEFNMYGYYVYDEAFEENLKDYRIRRNDKFRDVFGGGKYSLEDVKQFLNRFQEAYSYDFDASGGGVFPKHGRPMKWMVYEADAIESYKPDTEGFFDQPSEDEPADEYMIDDIIEYLGYWDGSNHNQKIYSSKHGYCNYIEVTEDYPDNWDEADEIMHTRDGQGQGHDEYYIWGNILIHRRVSYWQGDLNNEYIVISTLDEINDEGKKIILDTRDEDIIDKYIIEGLRSKLNEGEEIEYSSGYITLSYRGEEYHFENDEIIRSDIGWNGYRDNISFKVPLAKARKIIRKRRIEAVTSRFAKRNYKRVAELPLREIFVSYKDSIEAGNCKAITKEFKKEVGEQEQVSGDFSLRADVLLSYRDDNYSRRAVLKAYRNKIL